MSDAEHKKWLMQESYFGCSWTHIFHKWKCSQIMLGNTTCRVLLSMPQNLQRVLILAAALPEASLRFLMFFLASMVCSGMDLNGRTRAEELFSAEKNVKKIEQIYEDLIC